jgi:hypothetical protein
MEIKSSYASLWRNFRPKIASDWLLRQLEGSLGVPTDVPIAALTETIDVNNIKCRKQVMVLKF